MPPVSPLVCANAICPDPPPGGVGEGVRVGVGEGVTVAVEVGVSVQLAAMAVCASAVCTAICSSLGPQASKNRPAKSRGAEADPIFFMAFLVESGGWALLWRQPQREANCSLLSTSS